MHDSSLTKMRGFVAAYLAEFVHAPLVILDIGSQAVEGMQTYRSLFSSPAWSYRGLDVTAGANVDVVLNDPYQWHEVESETADVVVSGQALEHIEFPWETMREIARVLKPGGVACIIHRYPLDCWRIYPDGCYELPALSECRRSHCNA